MTGASGFLGSAVIQAALHAGVNVRATSRRKPLVLTEAEFQPSDLLDPPSLAAVVDGVEVVIHAAGLAHVREDDRQHRILLQETNERGTSNLVDTALRSGVRHIVLVSSVAVYGQKGDTRDEDAGCDPQGSYAQSKWAAERRVIAQTEQRGASLTILRMSTLCGEGDPGNVARLIRFLDRSRIIGIRAGNNRKSLVYRDDAARACVLALIQRVQGVFNVTAPPLRLCDIVETIAVALGTSLAYFSVPPGFASKVVAFGGKLLGGHGWLTRWERAVSKWLSDDAFDGEKARRVMGFEASVNPREALQREVAWYKSLNDSHAMSREGRHE